MYRRAILAAVSVLATVPARAATTARPADLVGTWDVDLRPKPDAAPYIKPFVVRAVSGNTFTGTFYDTEISEGRINADWGTLRVAFVTADGSGPYHHSAVLTAGRLEGMTHSIGRQFLAYWSATRK